MKKNLTLTGLVAMSVLVAACSSAPTSTSLLEQTRSDYMMAQNNPAVSNYAQLEFKQASDALDRANAAAAHNDSPEQVDKLAYLAKQRIATAMEVAKQKSAEADVAKSGQERDRIRLQARTQEADNAKAAAQAAQSQAEAATLAAQNAQMQAQNAEAATRDAQARADAMAAQLADLQAQKTERGIIITLGDVLFGTDQAALTADGVNTANKLGTVLQNNPARTVLIEGYTDSTGSSSHNLDLSQRRADSVRNALMAMGISRDRIGTRGYGEAFPKAGNDSASGRQLNRRVEIVLSEENAGIPAARR
jgi:outer membrane protein OmpA-like peptidoglycan-associated protein